MLWRFEIWENHFNLHTIITVWWWLSPSRYILWLLHLLEYTLVIIFKAFWSFCFLFLFLHIFLFKQIMHGHIRDRKEVPNYVKLLTFQFCYSNFAMPKHTNVIDIALLLCWSIHMSFYSWRATVVRWLFMPFS